MAKWLFGTLKYLLLVLIASCLVAELALRAHERFFLDPHLTYANEYRRAVDAHIHTLWTGNPSQVDPFLPPFPVFANRGADDPQRTERILNATRLPPSSSWEAYDFIRTDPETYKNESAYTVTSNSFGFRGREYSKVKPPNTYRIIALGTYQTFGLGVSDIDTYPAQLERLLNAQNDGMRYEVWNVGFPAATAIVGLHRMRNTILEFSPDLIIIDYGMLDDRIMGDNFFPMMALVPGSTADSFFKRFSGPAVSVLDHSLLWNRLMQKRFRDRSIAANFSSILQDMTDLAWDKHIPTILVQQYFAHTIDERGYVQLTSDHTRYFSVRNWFRDHPPEYPAATEWQTDFWASTYLAELDPARVSTSTYAFEYAPYRLNFYQLNARGMFQIAQGLAQMIGTDTFLK